MGALLPYSIGRRGRWPRPPWRGRPRAATLLQAAQGRRLVAEEEAAAAVEFALLLPLLMLLVLGTIDLGRFGFAAVTVANAARTGAATCNYVTVANCNASGYAAVIESAVQQEAAPYITIGSIASGDITPTYPTVGDPYLTVQVRHQFTTLIPWPGLPSSYNIVNRARMPVELAN